MSADKSMINSTKKDMVDCFEILRPIKWTSPVIFASPHSGRNYPKAFIESSRLKGLDLRRSEDAFVDEIFSSAPECGAPLIRAHFPRVYVDVNREPYELDPEMFDGPLPRHVNTTSTKVAAGLGTIARVVADGEEVYAKKLNFKDTENVIKSTYIPYHDALKDLLNQAHENFGCYLLIDCHSMPSIGGPMDRDPGYRRVDFILGDRFGTSCNGFVTDGVEDTLLNMNYSVIRNNPYAGGFSTANYGHPEKYQHSLQIEINRALYMNEYLINYNDGFERLKKNLKKLIEHLTRMPPESLKK